MNASDQGAASRCLSPDDPSPVIVHNSGARAPFLLVCDHAGRRIPRALAALGLEPPDLERHIAWDIGAGALARRIAEQTDAELFTQVYSRLVVDCNRSPDDAAIAPEVSDGTPIPANHGLPAAELAARLAEIHAPYHEAIAAALDRREGQSTVLVSIHSFTPSMSGMSRPWHVGVLHSHDSPVSVRALGALQGMDGLIVGDNEPYAMDGIDYTIPRHAKSRGLDYLELEVRQDLIDTPAGQDRLAAILAPLIFDVAAGRPDPAVV